MKKVISAHALFLIVFQIDAAAASAVSSAQSSNAPKLHSFVEDKIAIDCKGLEPAVYHAIYAGLERPIDFLYSTESALLGHLYNGTSFYIDKNWRDPLSGKNITYVVQRAIESERIFSKYDGTVLHLIIDQSCMVKRSNGRTVHRAQFFSSLELAKRFQVCGTMGNLPAKLTKLPPEPVFTPGNSIPFRLVRQVNSEGRWSFALSPMLEPIDPARLYLSSNQGSRRLVVPGSSYKTEEAAQPLRKKPRL